MKSLNRYLLILFVLFSCVGCDQLTKNIARHNLANSEPIILLNNFIRLQYIENPGAFLSLGAGSSDHVRFWIFTLLTGIFLTGMLFYLLLSPLNSYVKIISLSLVAGGGIGNLIDRIFNEGRVVDFINMGIGSLRTGIFNVADVVLSVGVVWFLFISFIDSKNKLNLRPEERQEVPDR